MSRKQYVERKTTYFYRGPDKDEDGHDHRHGVLIFGDELEALDAVENGRRKVAFRGKTGWVKDEALGDQRALECYFIDVGQGDSTFIVTPSGKTILIDGGVNQRALGFLAWKYRLHEGSEPLVIDLLVLSHADGDHLDGLVPIIAHPRIIVRQVIHSGIGVYKPKPGSDDLNLGAVEAVDGKKYLLTRHDGLDQLSPFDMAPSFCSFIYAVDREQTQYRAVDASSDDIDLGDPKLKIEVLGPRLIPHPTSGEPCLPWLGGASKTINGHSVVLRLTYDQVSILLPGDINEIGSHHLFGDPEFAARLSAHVLKAPHHGSHDFDPHFLAGVAPQIAVISSGDDRDHGHPRAAFIGAIGRVMRSPLPLVFSTEIAATFVEATSWSHDAEAGADNPFAQARVLFKRRLNGMINVRSDGKQLYAARRVAAGYAWEAYGPLPAVAADADPE